MPSPFPGMDPFAERPDVWLELHNRLMVYIFDAVWADELLRAAGLRGALGVR